MENNTANEENFEKTQNNEIKKFHVFLDTGLQKFFVPFYLDGVVTRIEDYPKSLKDAINEVERFSKVIPEETMTKIKEIFANNQNMGYQIAKDCSWLRCRYGKKTWTLKNGQEIKICGLWILVETNTSGQDQNTAPEKYDRGYFYKKDGFNQKELDDILENAQKQIFNKPGISHYIPLRDQEECKLTVFYGKEKLNLGGLEIILAIRSPNGRIRDVDLILDLGNTRTAGLLFDHIEDQTFRVTDLRQQFKILRLKPDPLSGEYEDNLDEVDAGITPSWIVLHALDSQTYKTPRDSKEPEFLQTEYKYKVEVIKRFLRKNTYNIDGYVYKRIPQMFSQLSPVLLGDRAERVFNLPYANNLISVGAKLHQSSPKRYYWDDTPGDVWWSMLLNEWDPNYIDNPKVANALPTLQGEMLRFIRTDGEKVDLSGDIDPTMQPSPYPSHPSYPKQSTLTWMLLHIIEAAYAQTNTSFLNGQNFIPHRLRKVSITYPSGWTKEEVNRYMERCKEALDIFSHTNIYGGLSSDLKLEMVPQESTPDEAVAGQLPFIFSEVVRHPNQTVSDWISIVGKQRQDKNGQDINTVRVMNFDIGGGTTDISIVEYLDQNDPQEGVNQNLLSTKLLYKDGRAIAGDNLVEKVIEKIILGGIISAKEKSLGDRIKNRFTTVLADKALEARRSRIVRTCLIPLATYCLTKLGINDSSIEFTAKDAGVKENNWKDFLKFIDSDATELRFDFKFKFRNSDINDLIENLFTSLFCNCAMYAAAYDIDLLIFSGKPSELAYIRTMANKYIPLDEGRIIFAREFKPGNWYPFIDEYGFIKDAKTVTVVGSALYYALSNGFIAGWNISRQTNDEVRNEWGEIRSMNGSNGNILLSKSDDSWTGNLLPNTIIARRQNRSSSPEPVYKFIKKGDNNNTNQTVNVTISRKEDNVDGLFISAVNDGVENVNDYELKLWPCESSTGFEFWQEVGKFPNIEGIESKN